jgi:hypothetical protein
MGATKANHAKEKLMKHVIKQCVLLLFSSSLLACAAPDERSEDATYAAERPGRDCISQSSIRDYQVLDESNLIVTEGVKRKYHVVLAHRAFGLRSTWQIGFRSMTGRICGYSADLIYNDGLTGPDSVSVRSIRQLGPEDLDDLLIRFGKKEPGVEQAPAQEEIKGAEVEELD